MQLHQPPLLNALGRSGGSLLVVSFAKLPDLADWLSYWQATFLAPTYAGRLLADVLRHSHFVADPQLAAYHAYGLGRNSLLRVYGPGILWQYVRWWAQGRRIVRPAEDPLQRGGDFVVGQDGRLTLAHVGRDQRDRPTMQQLIAAIMLQYSIWTPSLSPTATCPYPPSCLTRRWAWCGR